MSRDADPAEMQVRLHRVEQTLRALWYQHQEAMGLLRELHAAQVKPPAEATKDDGA